MSDAVVLTGAAVKGAFHRGGSDRAGRSGRQVSPWPGHPPRRGREFGRPERSVYATLLRTGNEANAGSRLARISIDDVTFGNAFSLSLRGIFGLRGIFDTTALLALMRKRLTASPGNERVTLCMVVTNADGHLVGQPKATTYEEIVTFMDGDFDLEDSLERVRLVAAASASIPGVFVPMRLNVNGRTFDAVDGGVVDDTPLSAALDNSKVRRVFVITPDPLQAPASPLRGLSYASQLLDILIEQRVSRDLGTARQVNKALQALTELIPDQALRIRVLDAIGWAGRRPVEIVEIRPDTPLPGMALSGIFSKKLREQYVNAGVEAATRVVARLVPVVQPTESSHV